MPPVFYRLLQTFGQWVRLAFAVRLSRLVYKYPRLVGGVQHEMACYSVLIDRITLVLNGISSVCLHAAADTLFL